MGVKFRTGGDELEYLWWEIEISWKMRREILQSKAVELNIMGGKGGFVVDTGKLREIMWPEGVRGWAAQAEGAQARSPVPRDDMTDEAFWSLDMAHLEGLAIQVGQWLVTGVEPAYDDNDSDRREAESGNEMGHGAGRSGDRPLHDGGEEAETGEEEDRGPLGIV